MVAVLTVSELLRVLLDVEEVRAIQIVVKRQPLTQRKSSHCLKPQRSKQRQQQHRPSRTVTVCISIGVLLVGGGLGAHLSHCGALFNPIRDATDGLGFLSACRQYGMEARVIQMLA